MWRDMERHCALLGLPRVQCPDPFPQNSLLAARIATALPPAARARFSCSVYRAEFSEGKSIADRSVMTAILGDIGGTAHDALTAAESPETKAALRQATEQAQSLGIYGAPSFTAGSGELFWGNDRLEHALAWAWKEASERRGP